VSCLSSRRASQIFLTPLRPPVLDLQIRRKHQRNLDMQCSEGETVAIMRGRILSGVLTLALVASITTLTAFAYASPPDPSWIRGMYDNADFDDVVGYLTSAAGSVDAAVVVDLRPIPVVVVAIPERDEGVVPSVLVCADRPRAPPTR
jgi:hypothetical protein